MVHINEKFKLIDKDKKIIGSILTSFFVINVILLIVTSGYSNDIAISVFFRKGMANNFLRGISSFLIADGFNSLITYAIPMALLILESLYVYLKKRKTVIPKIVYTIMYVVIYLVVFAIFEYFLIRDIPYYYAGNKSDGFNRKGLPYFVYAAMLSGGEFYSIYIISIVINNLIVLGLLAYIHFVLSKREDFIAQEYGLKSIQGLVYIGFLYGVYLQLSGTMNRPHPYRVKGNDWLQEIRTVNNGKYEKYYDIYIHQEGFNYGWTVKDGNKNPVNGIYNNQLSFPEQGPGGRNAIDQLDNFGQDYDFPSGHVDEMCISLNALMIIFATGKQDSKQRKLKFSAFGIMILGWVSMVFAMLIRQGHGMSDMAFSFVGAFPAYFLSSGLVKAVFKGIPSTKGFKAFDFETGYSIAYVLILAVIVGTSGMAVKAKGGGKNDILRLSMSQFAFGITALLTSVFSLTALILEKKIGLKFIARLFDTIVLTIAAVVSVFAFEHVINSAINTIEIVVLALTSCSLTYSVVDLSFNVAKIEKANLSKQK